jgi:NitT/TauT family transport system substrate-binding protein
VLPVVRIVCLPTDPYGEAYYAQDMGFFTKHGIHVDIVAGLAGSVAVTAVAGNSAEIGVAAPIQVALAYAKGIPVSIIAGGGLYSTTSAAQLMVIPKESPLRTPKDLEGKTVGVPQLGDQLQTATKVWMLKNGVDATKVKFIEINPGKLLLGAMMQGHVDAITTPEPTLTAALQSGARIFGDPFGAISPRFFVGVWVARNDWLKSDPDLAHRFADAIYEAGVWANAHPDESAAILAKYAKVDVATFRGMRRTAYTGTAIDTRLVQPPLDTGLQLGLLPSAVKASDMVYKGF